MQLEDHRTEYKLKLTDQLEKEIVGFLNTREGGILYIGVSDDGQVVGVDEIDVVQRKVIDRIRSNIVPPTMGLFEVTTETQEKRTIIKVMVLSGTEKPYYIRSKGMSPEGAYIRIGSSTQPMTHEMIESAFSKRTRTSLKNIPSPHQDLTFAQLRIYYEENGLELNEQFARSLDLLTEDGRLNYFAYLLADRNSISIKIARYRGSDKVDLIENKEFGYCSLIKATFNVLNRMDIENVPRTRITSTIREETFPVDPVSLREAIVNAIVHNDYIREIPPVFEIYSDKIVITSAGGLMPDMQEEEFFLGYSAPRNRELMRVFKDVQLVEHIGSGIPRILRKYDRSIFKFTQNFLRVTFEYPESIADQSKTFEDKPAITSDRPAITGDRPAIDNSNYRAVLEYLKTNDLITNSSAMEILGLKASQTRQILSEMVEQDYLEAHGEKRYRYYVAKI
ncbi:MAG: putative DNA binding domain-containing protein [Eubacteriales bacterium]|nr:putative DNA binding domain-containing protein [Eubacteriales bacterium]